MRRLLLSIGVALCGAVSAPAETYTLTQINPPPGVSSSSVESLNNLSQVVGNTSVKAGRFNAPGRPFVWANGVHVTLPPLGSDAAAGASAISDSGLIVGHSPRLNVYSEPARAVWWQKIGAGYVVGNWNDFDPMAADGPVWLYAAVAISPDGKYVVFDAVNIETGHDQAVVAEVAVDGGSPSGFAALWLIDSLDGSVSADGFVSAGVDISHDGSGLVRVVGYAKLQGSSAQGFLWEMDAVTGDVRLVDLDPSSGTFSSGEGVNASGEVTGHIEVAGLYQAHFWDSAGDIQNIGTLGGTTAFALSINDAGFVTGWSQRSGKNANRHAFLWHLDTDMRDLNALKSAGDTSGIELTSAGKISNAGEILAYGLRKSVGVNVLLKRIP